MSSVKTACSQAAGVDAAVEELRERLGSGVQRLVIAFASPAYPAGALSAALERAFAPAAVIGCSTAGEMVSGAVLKKSVVAMALSGEQVQDVAVELVADLSPGSPALAAALASFGRRFGTPVRDLDPARYVGLVLCDGLSGAEERLMDGLSTATDVIFVGGSAGDDLAFQATHVFTGGAAHRGAALLAILRLDHGFSVIKTQSFAATGKRLTATRVDEASRTVLAFDGKPAAQAYAAALGVPAEALAALFMSHPLGLMAGDEPYVRSPQQVVGEGVKFYCAIAEGTELEILRSTDIVEETRHALERKQRMLGSLSAVVSFNCILRALELDKNGQAQAYGKLFAEVPTVGFSTYGEAYLGHVNQTATMLVLR